MTIRKKSHSEAIFPRIENLPETRLAGLNCKMSLVENRTRELWQSFMPQLGQVPNRMSAELYAVDIYPDLAYFRAFDPNRRFIKWAAVPVQSWEDMPGKFDKLVLPEGLYAVFRYRGTPADVAPFYRRILEEWLISSTYQLDNRPHLAVMGAAYKGNHPESEEDLWIPVRPHGEQGTIS